MKRIGKVKIEWSAPFAYAIGLITSDGNLSIDGRHINFTSKDRNLVICFRKCLGLQNRIGRKARAKEKIKRYYQVQFGDKNFYEFLLSIGLMPAKSKNLRDLKIEERYFADFLRGCIDGDGSIGAFSHPESRHPQIRLRVASASVPFLKWLHGVIKNNTVVQGGWIETTIRAWALVFGKADALELLQFIYYSRDVPCLKRKEQIARRFLRI